MAHMPLPLYITLAPRGCQTSTSLDQVTSHTRRACVRRICDSASIEILAIGVDLLRQLHWAAFIRELSPPTSYITDPYPEWRSLSSRARQTISAVAKLTSGNLEEEVEEKIDDAVLQCQERGRKNVRQAGCQMSPMLVRGPCLV
jgi:hypothetical protein